jgi:ribonuclease P protein component
LGGGYSFSRRQRLLKAAEFEAVFAHRCSWRTPLFQILAQPNRAGLARLGMVVSKRLLSRSVDRNRMRRKIREAFRLIAADLPALDLVVRPLALPEQKNQDWREELLSALMKAAEKCRA